MGVSDASYVRVCDGSEIIDMEMGGGFDRAIGVAGAGVGEGVGVCGVDS